MVLGEALARVRERNAGVPGPWRRDGSEVAQGQNRTRETRRRWNATVAQQARVKRDQGRTVWGTRVRVLCSAKGRMDANATSCSRRAVTADGKPGRGGLAWVRIAKGSRAKPLVVEWRERVRNATFGPRACAQTCGKGCPQGVRHNAPKGQPCRERDCAATFMSQTVWHG